MKKKTEKLRGNVGVSHNTVKVLQKSKKGKEHTTEKCVCWGTPGINSSILCLYTVMNSGGYLQQELIKIDTEVSSVVQQKGCGCSTSQNNTV